jgi:hypothetical protein
LGPLAWDAAVDSGLALDFRLRNNPALSLLLVADAATMPAARQHLEQRAELFKTGLRLREQPLIGPALAANARERALTSDEEAAVLFTTRPIAWDHTARDGRLLRGTFLRHRWDLLPALRATGWRGVWVFGTGEAGQALVRQLHLARGGPASDKHPGVSGSRSCTYGYKADGVAGAAGATRSVGRG